MILHHINGSAMDKPRLFHQVLHDRIVTMGIDTQMAALCICPVQAEHSDPLFGAVRCDTVYDAVRTVVQPRTVRNLPVRRFNIRSAYIEKRADNLSRIIRTDITAAVRDILAQGNQAKVIMYGTEE